MYTSLASLAEVMMEGGQERREEIFFLYNLIFSNTIKKNRREHIKLKNTQNQTRNFHIVI